jgi:hypothetical protein
VRSQVGGPTGTVYALCLAGDGDRVHILTASHTVGRGSGSEFEIRVTRDGSDPATASVFKGGSIAAADRVRAALLVDGATIVEADSAMPRFRIPGSTAPAGS